MNEYLNTTFFSLFLALLHFLCLFLSPFLCMSLFCCDCMSLFFFISHTLCLFLFSALYSLFPLPYLFSNNSHTLCRSLFLSLSLSSHSMQCVERSLLPQVTIYLIPHMLRFSMINSIPLSLTLFFFLSFLSLSLSPFF